MRLLGKLLPYLRPYRWHIVLVVFCTLGATAMMLVGPWLIRSLIQTIADSARHKY